MRQRAISPGAWDQKHLWHPFTQQTEWEKEPPLVVSRARGSRFWDTAGRSYIDGVSSLWVTAHGHGDPDLNRALSKQLKKMAHTTFLGLTHEPAIQLGRELLAVAPKGLERIFYSDNGATAVEVALKMSFQYWAQRGRPEKTLFLSVRNSYHGDTLGAVSVGGIDHFHKTFRPLLFTSVVAPSTFCDTCPFRRKPAVFAPRSGNDRVRRAPRAGETRNETGCRWECLAGAERLIVKNKKKLAAAILEPLVQGASGMLPMPAGYLKGLHRLCLRHDVHLIVDEVATGFGRTGTMFAVEQENVTPDFLCLAKSITGGYLPLAATLTTKKIFGGFVAPYDRFQTFFHGHTYTANPLACAVGAENLRLYRVRGTLRQLRPKITALTEFLKKIQAHPRVGTVRQVGFMAGIPLVANKEHGTPFPIHERRGARVCRAARKHGVWIRPLGDVLVLLPPMGIPLRDLRLLFRGVENALNDEFL